jgi:negative regulator of flagellin synthesis FlgM
MSNPIDNGQRINGSVTGIGRKQSEQVGKTASTPAGAPTGTDGLADASVQSERLLKIREAIDSTPEVDAERVETIKRAIAEGEFPVDPQRIAEKFAELESLLNN